MHEVMDCQGLAGGFTLGAVQAGFELVGKREQPGGFGIPAMEANRHLLGHRWEAQDGPADTWEPRAVPYVLANPPCSGFSLMSNKDFRGMDSKINSCMWDAVGFAARCQPYIYVMESVGQAFTQGRDLMVRLREDMEKRTGYQYDITHVMQDALSLGGCAVRRRYFLVMHAIPFGVEPVTLKTVPTVGDAIEDLLGAHLTWERQPITRPATWYSKTLRGRTKAVDGHVGINTMGTKRVVELLQLHDWPERTPMQVVIDDYVAKHGSMPPLYDGHPSRQKLLDRALAGESNFGYNQPMRWDWNQPARVITGGALNNVVHPIEPRLLTHREALRILGFPDNWNVLPLKDDRAASMYWGKGVSVQVGRWISTWVKHSLEGEPGTMTGEVIGDRERFVDVSKDWRKLVGKDRIPLRLLQDA